MPLKTKLDNHVLRKESINSHHGNLFIKSIFLRKNMIFTIFNQIVKQCA